MPATKRLVLDLPQETLDLIEARVEAGEYADISQAVVAGIDRLVLADTMEQEDTPEYEAWLAEGDEVVARIRAGQERLTSAEEVFAKIESRLAEVIGREAGSAA